MIKFDEKGKVKSFNDSHALVANFQCAGEIGARIKLMAKNNLDMFLITSISKNVLIEALELYQETLSTHMKKVK